MWKTVQEHGNKVQFRKSRTFVAGLALKQNQPDIALQILEGETTYVSMRHIKLLAWSRTTKFEAIFDMFHSLFKLHEENKKRMPLTSIEIVSYFYFILLFEFIHLFSVNIAFQLNAIEGDIRKLGTKQEQETFQSIRKKIVSMELITKEVHVTLFNLL